MSNPRRAATVYPTLASIAASSGPELEQYRIPLDRPVLYKWIVGNTDTTDSIRILGYTGGIAGTWKEVRFPDQGANLTDADQTIYVSGDVWRVIPAATLGANRTKTLGTTYAEEGDRLEITRLDVGAYTVAIVNGGPGAGTLVTLPVSIRSFAKFYFDGTNWQLREAAIMPS